MTTPPTPLPLPLLESLSPDEPGETATKRGMRLWRVEVLNWGTLGEDVVHAADLSGGWLCITGRNGTGKSTLADAIITAFPPANARIHYNAAGGAKNTKERTRLTYLRGFFGQEQDETGRAQPSALRAKPGTLTAILLQFHEESSSRWVTLLVLGTFNQNLEEQWLYGVLEGRADLSVVQGKEDWDTRAKRLRNKLGWWLTADPCPYRERMRALLRIPSEKAITTFVRTVGLKDIGDVNEFIRGNMLDDVSVHRRYEDLTKHYAKQLEIDAEIASTREMVETLRPLETLVPEMQRLQGVLSRKKDVEGAMEWRIHEIVGGFLLELKKQKEAALEVAEAEIRAAERDFAQHQQSLADAETSAPALRAEAFRSRSAKLEEERAQIEAALRQLRAALSVLQMEAPADASSFAEFRLRLTGLVDAADTNAELRGDKLAAAKQLVTNLQARRQDVIRQRRAAEQSGTHLPADDLDCRDQIAEAVGLSSGDLPFFAELVDVDPTQEAWRVALEKLLRGHARRMLVPTEHFPKVAAHVNATDFGRRVRMERVYLKNTRPPQSGSGDTQRAWGKLRVRPGSPFSDWMHQTLRTRFDHMCFDAIQDYERHVGMALTKAGLTKDRGDYHEKKDDVRIVGPRDYFLGWSNEGLIRALESEEATLDAQLAVAVKGVAAQRGENDDLQQRRNVASDVLAALPRFDLIDIGSVNKRLALLAADRETFAKTDPEAAAVAGKIEEARKARDAAKKRENEARDTAGGIRSDLKGIETDLRDIDEWTAKRSAPDSALSSEVEIFFKSPLPAARNKRSAWETGVRAACAGHFQSITSALHDTELRIRGLMSDYLGKFPKEVKELDTNISAAPAFLERLRYLEGERLQELLERFRKHLEENLALHVSQLKSDLDGQVSEAEARIEHINRILAQIPWEGSTVIRILPRPNPQEEIKAFREMLSRASQPLFQPTEEQNRVAFNTVKELIAYLAHDNVRKLVLDARQWRIFSVGFPDPRATTEPTRRAVQENTDGLSGGQKNKLSVTLLASALAYQYGLAGQNTSPGTFRTVIIDEAFARLDTENARYALELFKRFDFQLVLVHPLDGTVRVAEDYVHCFLLATIRDGRHTTLTGVRIQQFRDLVAQAEAERALDGQTRARALVQDAPAAPAFPIPSPASTPS